MNHMLSHLFLVGVGTVATAVSSGYAGKIQRDSIESSGARQMMTGSPVASVCCDDLNACERRCPRPR